MQLSYKISCRECLNLDGILRLLSMPDTISDEYLKMTEYQVMKKVEAIREKGNMGCQVCSSSNIEVYDVSVDGTLLYNFDVLAKRGTNTNEEMLIIGISKDNGICKPQHAGKKILTTIFANDVLIECLDLIDNLDEKKCVSHHKGFFCICYTGYINEKTMESKLRLERLLYHGLSKDEIFTNFRLIIDKVKGLST